jgi:cellulose synthase/poly-beta-1,6-N-acetylglucosamine synthase-like glycosyltransferase
VISATTAGVRKPRKFSLKSGRLLDFILRLLFWCSAALLFHNFLGFRLSLKFLALFKRAETKPPGEFLPTLTVFIPAHNEEKDIAAKLDSVLVQGYPADKLEIIVASDVSTDRTVEIVNEYASRGVTLIEYKVRHGKLGALDELIPLAKGEVVVITDANVILADGALQRIASVYADPRVGAAGGYQTVEHPNRQTSLREEVTYRSFEVEMKKILSHFGLLVGAFGGFYSIRRLCFRPIGPKAMNDDIVLPLEVIGQRYKSLFVADAVAYEAIGDTIEEEYRRRIRMTAYNLNALGRAIKLGAKGGILALYIVLSYKVLRWLAPFLWLILAISSYCLENQGGIYRLMTWLFTIGLGAVLIGWSAALNGMRWVGFSQTYYFAKMNYATLPGTIQWLRGVKRYWAPRTV